MSNNPKAIQLAIGENDEWGNAMRRMTAVRPDDIPYTWQHISVKLDRIMDGSFFSLGIGVDYKAAGTWLAIDDVIISDQPIPTPEVMPQYDITIPMVFGNLAYKQLATTISKMAELDPEMKNILHGLTLNTRLIPPKLCAYSITWKNNIPFMTSPLCR